MRHSQEQNYTCYFLNDLEVTVFDSMQEVLHDDLLSLCIDQTKEEVENNLELVKQVAYMESNGIVVRKKEFEEIDGSKGTKLKPSIEDLPTLELKELANHLQ